jgi:hypothetical protein
MLYSHVSSADQPEAITIKYRLAKDFSLITLEG